MFSNLRFKLNYWLSNYNGLNDKLLSLAFSTNFDEIIQLIEQGADLHTNYEYVLRRACRWGDLKTVKYLVQRGANIHILDEDALVQATFNGHLEVVKYLVEKGANINSKEWILRSSVCYGHLDIFKYLLEQGCVLDENINNILISASNHLEIIIFLLQKGADIYFEDNYILRNALRHKLYNIVNYLIDSHLYSIDEIASFSDDFPDIIAYLEARKYFIFIVPEVQINDDLY